MYGFKRLSYYQLTPNPRAFYDQLTRPNLQVQNSRLEWYCVSVALELSVVSTKTSTQQADCSTHHWEDVPTLNLPTSLKAFNLHDSPQRILGPRHYLFLKHDMTPRESLRSVSVPLLSVVRRFLTNCVKRRLRQHRFDWYQK